MTHENEYYSSFFLTSMYLLTSNYVKGYSECRYAKQQAYKGGRIRNLYTLHVSNQDREICSCKD